MSNIGEIYHTAHVEGLKSLKIINDADRLVPSSFQPDIEQAIMLACQTEYPGYPSNEKRLHLSPQQMNDWRQHLEKMNDISSQTFHVANHQNRNLGIQKGLARMDDGRQIFPPNTFQNTYEPIGFSFDSRGIPLHPYADTMLMHGALTGFGFYWDYGPNRTADPVVVRQDSGKLQILVIKRSDTQQLALPGGMQDKEEADISTALRELEEETGARLEEEEKIVVYKGVVADQRATLNAWSETAVVLFMPSKKVVNTLDLRPGGDAIDFCWLDANMNNIASLFASHGDFVRLAILKWQEHAGLVVDKNGVIGLPEKG